MVTVNGEIHFYPQIIEPAKNIEKYTQLSD